MNLRLEITSLMQTKFWMLYNVEKDANDIAESKKDMGANVGDALFGTSVNMSSMQDDNIWELNKPQKIRNLCYYASRSD